MWQFLQNYGIWILFAIFFVLMMRMHMGGMRGMHRGGGAMNMDRSSEEPSDIQQAIPLDKSQSETVVRDISPEGKIVETNGSSGRHHSHC